MRYANFDDEPGVRGDWGCKDAALAAYMDREGRSSADDSYGETDGEGNGTPPTVNAGSVLRIAGFGRGFKEDRRSETGDSGGVEVTGDGPIEGAGGGSGRARSGARDCRLLMSDGAIVISAGSQSVFVSSSTSFKNPSQTASNSGIALFIDHIPPTLFIEGSDFLPRIITSVSD
jgi:hypothetical protein